MFFFFHFGEVKFKDSGRVGGLAFFFSLMFCFWGEVFLKKFCWIFCCLVGFRNFFFFLFFPR